MKALEIDIGNIRERGVIADIGDNLKLDIIYNTKDDYLYVSILDSYENRLVGFNRLVPNIDLISLSNNDINKQLRCIKVNQYAELGDKITPENLNTDYKFFLIDVGVKNGEVMETN